MGSFIKDVNNGGDGGSLPNNNFTNKAYLLKVTTKKDGAQESQKSDDVVYE